jgi:tetratricopeptide (TPR) repeat protein
VARRLGDRQCEGDALTSLGLALAGIRRFEEAIAAHQQAAAIYRDTADHREAMALNNLGLALRRVRRFEEAITACQDAAAIHRDTADDHREAMALNNLGLALREVRRFEEAIAAHQQAAAIHRDTADHHGEATALTSLGLALAGAGRLEQAITACQRAVAILGEAEDERREQARHLPAAKDVAKTVSGGAQYGPVLQGRDFTGLTFTTAPRRLRQIRGRDGRRRASRDPRTQSAAACQVVDLAGVAKGSSAVPGTVRTDSGVELQPLHRVHHVPQPDRDPVGKPPYHQQPQKAMRPRQPPPCPATAGARRE